MSSFWLVVLVPGLLLLVVIGEKPVKAQQAKSTFSCDGRTSGYYADVSAGCQVYHMCDGLGRQFSYRCPSKTLFQQRMLICDHWYMVNCSKAEEDYSANLLIGQQGRPFVEDLQFHRTPRPDLADPRVSSNFVETEESSTEYAAPSHWSTEASPSKRQDSDSAVAVFAKQSYYQTDYNSRARFLASNQPRANGLTNAGETKPKVSMEFNKAPPLPRQRDSDVVGTVNFPSKFRATTPVYPKHVDFDPSKLSEFDVPVDTNKPDGGNVNFASKFKATTPVYPKTVDVDLSKFSGAEELPPVDENAPPNDNVVVNFASSFKATTPVYPHEVPVDQAKFQEPLEIPKLNENDNNIVNFVSSFHATTPVYPQSVEATSPIPEEFGLLPPRRSNSTQQVTAGSNTIVNFASKFKATTPVYPKSVESTSPDPSNVGLAAPREAAQPSVDVEPPSFEDTFKRRIDEEPSVVGHTFNNQQLNEFMVTIKPEQLKDLKQLWKIPEYDFPLETVVRPGYESEFSSFRDIGKTKS